MQSDSALFDEPSLLTARVRGKVVGRVFIDPLLTKQVLRVPLESEGDKCVVRFEVDRTAIPKVVTDGENPDPRELGLHFNRFDYRGPLAATGSRRAKPGSADG